MSALIWGLVAVAFVAIDVLRGGSRMAFAFPAYGLLAIAGLLCFVRPRGGNVPRSTWVCLGATFLFFGYLLVRIGFSPDEYLARRNLYLILAALVVYTLTVWHLGLSRYRMWLVAVLLVLGVVNSVMGAVQFFQDPNFPAFPLWPRTEYGWRARGFFVSPNHLAGLLEICAILGLTAAWWSRWSIYAKIIAAFSALVCLGGLLLTGSRGGYLGALCGLSVFVALSLLFMMTQRDRRRWVAIVVIAGIAAAVGWGVKGALARSYRLDDRATSMVEESGDLRRLLGIRRQLGNAALKQFQLSPVVGTGSGTYLYYGRTFRSPLSQRDPIYAHNDYLQLAAEFGAVGLAGFFIFLIVHLRRGWQSLMEALVRARREGMAGSHSLGLTVAALSCVAAYAAHSMLDFNLQIPANTLVVAFLFGVLARPASRPDTASGSSGAAGEMIPRLAIPALGLWLGCAALPKFPAEISSEKARTVLSGDAHRESPEIARQAVEQARRGLSVDPKNPQLYYLQGEALMAVAEQISDAAEQERMRDEAAASYREGLRLAPMDRNLVLCLGWALDALQRPEEAEEYFKRALQLDPNAADVQWAYAAHLHARGWVEEAEAAYRTAAQLGSQAATAALHELEREKKPN